MYTVKIVICEGPDAYTERVFKRFETKREAIAFAKLEASIQHNGWKQKAIVEKNGKVVLALGGKTYH